MRTKRYELYYLVNYLKYSCPPFWLYYGRYRTYKGAVEALRANRAWFRRVDIHCKLGKIRDSEDGSVSFYDVCLPEEKE